MRIPMPSFIVGLSAFQKICFAKPYSHGLEIAAILAKIISGTPPISLPMTDIFNRFSLHAAKFNGQVWLCLGIIWLVVLACAITSIYMQPFSVRQRRFWILTVIFAPLLGVLAYLPFSFRREQLAQLFFIRSQRDRSSRHATSPIRIAGGRKA